MKIKQKYCIDCGHEGTHQRKRCFDCYVKYNRKRVSEYDQRRKKLGIKKTRYGKSKCCICNEDMIKNRPNQIAHGKCRKKNNLVSYNTYPRDKGGKTMAGRRAVLDLGIVIPKKVIVHHIDENPINNSYKNLMIMSQSNHASLHSFLKEQWVINKGIYGDKLEKTWKRFLSKLNDFWIEKNNIKVVKIHNNFKKIKIKNDCIYVIDPK